MKIILTGGTGFIGTPLRQRLLEKGYEVLLLTRNPASIPSQKGLTVAAWDGKTVRDESVRLQGVDAVINLAGEPIATKRWTQKQKEKILSSRIDATRAIVFAMAKSAKRPSVLINASAVGFYGNVPEGDVTDDHPRGTDFLAETCSRWEEEARAAEPLGVRVVRLRIGIVLAEEGGALRKMLLPFKLFAGGPPGSGRQWFPWIHRDDVIGAILFALDHPNLSGPVNLTTPAPVTMKEFCKSLGKAIRRPSWAPVPAFVLKAILGEMAEVVLSGQRAIPKKLMEGGYKFRYPALGEALASLKL